VACHVNQKAIPRSGVPTALAAALFAVAAVAGCGDPPLLLCGQIPTGGCPIGRGGSCADKSCTGVYDCVNGKWTETQACPASTTSSSGATGSTGSTGSGMCMPGVLNHTGETTGCTPDLESPDCPASAAETCSPCTTGCADFFMCLGTGWTDVGFCTAAGQLVVTQK